jgi:hypothetical protein
MIVKITNRQELARKHQLLLRAKSFTNVIDLVEWLNTLPVEDRRFLRDVIKQEDVATY